MDINRKEENEFVEIPSCLDNVNNRIGVSEESDAENVLCKSDHSDKNENVDKPKTKETEKDDKHEFKLDDEEDTICGFGRFKPKCLQKYATSRNYLILYSLAGVIQGSYFAYVIGVVSTLEKRFAFTGKISGVIMTIDEVTPLALGVFVGYFGGRAHRPRIVALGMFFSVLCCLFSALPFFIYGPAQHLVYSNTTGPEVCDFRQKEEECGEDDRPPTLSAVVFLIFGSFLKGFANLAYYALGLSYMDDITQKKNTPVYIGIFFILRELGPIVGFLMSSAFLKIYENPFVDPGFGPEDPRWIGAWWMGFVLQGVLLLLFTFPFALFPRRLPSQRRAARRESTTTLQHESLVQHVKGLFAGLKRLSTNKLYVFQALATICAVIRGTGLYSLLPKYMENQFRLSASDASLYTGPAGLVALQITTIIGSVIIWKFRLQAKALIACAVICEICGVIICLLLMIPWCPSIEFAGTTTTENRLELKNECNAGCECTTKVFMPLCGPDGVSTYFSSCHAGCFSSLPKDEKGTEAFGDCSCVLDSNGSFITVDKIEKGFCPDEKCWTQVIIYVVLFCCLELFSSMFWTGYTMVILRCVDPKDKSLALGTFEAIACLFGAIPSPIAFGAIADSTCLIWEESCGSTGNCWFYNTQKFNYRVHGVCASFYLIASLCFARIYPLGYKIRDMYEEDGDLEEKNQSKHDDKGNYTFVNVKAEENMQSTSL